MTYVIHGKIGDDAVLIRWDNGVITTNATTLRFLEIEAKHRDSLDVPGMDLDPKNWNDRLAFFFLAEDVLDEITNVTGEVPTLPDVPEGAIP